MSNPNPSMNGRNKRTALVLASIALVFFLGIVARYWLLGT